MNRLRTSRVATLLLLLSAVVGSVFVGVSPAGASSDAGGGVAATASGLGARRVLIISAPRLTWDAVQQLRPPHLLGLFAQGSVAMCSIRADGPVTTPGEGYLTLGAGNRMATSDSDDGRVVGLGEHVAGGSPAVQFRRTTGRQASKPIVALGLPGIERANKGLSYGAVAGSLAQALSAHGRSMAVIGNADHSLTQSRFRHVGLAAIDHRGEVAAGDVSSRLLLADDLAPFGVRLDADVVASTFASTWEHSDVVLVELSDLERAEAARRSSTPDQARSQFADAVSRSDELVGRLLDHVDLTRDLVMVVAPTIAGTNPGVTVFGATGAGMPRGWARSASTRRDGYVELTDIASTVLRNFGIAVPEAVNDTPILGVRRPSEPLDARIASMARDGRRAQVRDASFGPIAVVFIILLVLDLCLAIACLSREPRLVRSVRGLALVVLAALPMSFLTGLLPTYRFNTLSMLGIVYGGAVLLALAVTKLRRFHAGLPPLALMALLWAILTIDIVTGGWLQLDTPFGYSPIVAGRFAGFGNQAFSMLALSGLMVASYFVEQRCSREGPADAGVVAMVGVFFAVTLLVDGHPALGSDVGGVLAFLPAAAIALLLFRRVRIRARLIVAIIASSVVVIGGFAALDMSRPAESRTHLSRFVMKIFDGHAGEVLQRKLDANLSVLTNVWTWFIPIAMIYFAYLTWRPNRTFSRLRGAHREFHAFEVSALLLGVLSMLLNDSGISMPAMMTGMVVVWVSYMVMDLEIEAPT